MILATTFLLVVLEFSVRLFFPEINYQGNERSMFLENRFGESMGLRPDASGTFFGKTVHTDMNGFRQLDIPAQHDQSWLFVGDSVTFGVAVDDDKIFPQLVQNRFPHTRVWNAAVVGYGANDYLNVVSAFADGHSDLERIILFFCLNDVYGNLSFDADSSPIEASLSFLRRNSKLYQLLKGTFFDQSRKHALHDISYFEDRNPNFEAAVGALENIKAIADELGAELLVVIVPYEYQLRVDGLRAPQALLTKRLAEQGIAFLDLYEAFESARSEDYFLYGDPMHLSDLGHKTVADELMELMDELMDELIERLQ